MVKVGHDVPNLHVAKHTLNVSYWQHQAPMYPLPGPDQQLFGPPEAVEPRAAVRTARQGAHGCAMVPLTADDERALLASSCEPAAPAITVCCNRSHGLAVLRASSSSSRATMLRVGGPHPQTVLFARSASRSQATWVAPFALCRAGEYHVHVRHIIDDPFAGGRWWTGCPVHFAPEAVLVARYTCLLYTSPSPRDGLLSRMPSSA